ncbi:MAG: PAS domain S-box protein, partial [Pseudorhodobacter sp.]|nr:PAS domain S-box protein [Frankiaceae bacterium]
METVEAREAQRLNALAAYSALDTAPEPAFDDLAAAAAQIAGVPYGMVSLLDEHRLWFKAATGLPVEQVDRDIAFCAHTVAADDVLIVPDAQQDPRFADNPLVTGPPHLRFYAGFPLRTSAGHVLGALCVLGPHPTDLDTGQRRLLQVLADQVMSQLELRRQAAEQGQARRQATELAERLARSEQRYRLLAEHATDIVSRLAPDGTVLYVSPSLRTVLGGDPKLEIGAHAQDRAHPDDQGLLDEAMRPVVAGDGPVTLTLRARHADGSCRWLETTLSALLAADGSLLELYSTARDVTARIQADQAREEPERRHRELVEQTPDAILVQVDGLITFANGAAARLFKATGPQDLVGRAVADLADPVNRQQVLERLRILLAGGSVPTLRQGGRRLDGTWVTVDASGSRVDFGGRPGTQNVLRDVTDQQEAAAAILLSEQQHRSLFELSPVGLLESDLEGRIIRANRAFAALVGRSMEELAGVPMRDLGAPLLPGDHRIAARALAGEDSPAAARTFVRPDGTSVQTSLSSAVVRSANGTVERIVVTVVDMTERNTSRAALEGLVTELQVARAEADQRTALLDAVLETIDVGVVACDAAGRLILFNRATREFHGLPEHPDVDPADWAEHYALRAEDGVTALEPDQVPLYRALVEGHVSDQHITVTPTGLPLRTLRVDGRALRDGDGHVTGAVVAMKDVTELRASEQRFRAAFQNGPTPMARLDPDGTVRDANPALRRFLSVPTSRLLGRRLTDRVHPDDITPL